MCLKVYILTRIANSDDFFNKYFKILPKNFHNFPYFYSKSDLKLLKNSFFLEDLKVNFKSETLDYINLIEQFPSLKKFDKYEFLKISLLVNSRMFFTEENGVSEYMMVPISDLFNHNFDNNAHWRYNTDSNTFEIYSTKNIEKGEEIQLSYGEKGNNEYLLHYGFTISDNKFGERSVYFYNYLDKEMRDIIELTEKLRKKNFEFSIDFKGFCVFNSLSELREIYFIFNNEEEINGLKSDVDFKFPVSLENEENVINSTMDILSQIEKEYSSDLKV